MLLHLSALNTADLTQFKLGASSILQMEGVNLSLMESKQGNGRAGTGQ